MSNDCSIFLGGPRRPAFFNGLPRKSIYNHGGAISVSLPNGNQQKVGESHTSCSTGNISNKGPLRRGVINIVLGISRSRALQQEQYLYFYNWNFWESWHPKTFVWTLRSNNFAQTRNGRMYQYTRLFNIFDWNWRVENMKTWSRS